jgi:peptide/nickel transport system substrate-binding protein
MPGQAGQHLASLAQVAVLALAVAGCTVSPDATADQSSGGVGGTGAVGTVYDEPQTFNRLAASDDVSVQVSQLTQAGLVRINRATDLVEPWLAESWSSADDGRTHTLTLREGVTFSDGAPFGSADVLFSFQALYDERVGSTMADSLLIDGRPLEVDAVDAATVVVRFPVPYSPGLRLLDGLPMLPRHLLEPALGDGTLQDAWGLATPPADMAGLGPFVLQSYQPGQRLVFARNPRYWRQDAAGVALPYLDRVTLEIVADQNAEMLRLETGQVDFISGAVRAEDVASLARAAEAGQVRLVNTGVGLDADFLAFNLQPAAMQDDPRQGWLQSRDWRLAVSHAVDRVSFADTIYLGLAEPVFGPVTPGNRTWYWPDVPVFDYDVDRARALLDGLELRDRDGDGLREDAGGRPVRFTLLTNQGNSVRERAAQVLQADLGQVGIGVDVVPLEFGALIDRVVSMNFDAIYFGILASDTDPAGNLDFWQSSATFHLWNPSQPSPATDWERRIDTLMGQQMTAADLGQRQRLFGQVQTLFAEHQPVLYFAAPEMTVATSARLANVQPSLLEPYVLWNADMLAIRAPR